MHQKAVRTMYLKMEHFQAGARECPSAARDNPVGYSRAVSSIFPSVDQTKEDFREKIIGLNIDPQGYKWAESRKNAFTCFYGRPEFAENARLYPD